MAKVLESLKSRRIVSVSTALFDGYEMEVAIDEIAHSGARHVEPAYIKGYVDFDETAFEEGRATALGAIVGAAGLSAHAVSAHMDLSMTDAAEALARRIGFAAELGASVLITNAGPMSGRDAIMTAIETVLPRLEDTGIMLALENPGHGTGDLIGSAREGKRLVEAIGSTSVRLNHDAGNVFTYSREHLQPAEDLLAAAYVIGHAHLKDVKASEAGWSFTALGAGDVDLAAYLTALPKEMPLSIELPLRLRRPGRADPVRDSARLDLATIREKLATSLAFVASFDG
jgi:sugar phosphate isomerase/epimerase